jgi:hypothetical protein
MQNAKEPVRFTGNAYSSDQYVKRRHDQGEHCRFADRRTHFVEITFKVSPRFKLLSRPLHGRINHFPLKAKM